MSDPHTLLNALPAEQARAALAQCCGSQRWVSALLARRPWASAAALYVDAETVWSDLLREDFLEAFACHPRIGARGGDARGDAHDGVGVGVGDGVGQAWSRQEQARVGRADAETRRSLADANQRYLQRFGYIFIVCATGKSAKEMLALLELRLANDPARELAIAAGEQARITRLRLEKLGA
jgi:2-oxo-4-hydroxy-4-carboxy-5-ureidoimidazoline decarboxylase